MTEINQTRVRIREKRLPEKAAGPSKTRLELRRRDRVARPGAAERVWNGAILLGAVDLAGMTGALKAMETAMGGDRERRRGKEEESLE